MEILKLDLDIYWDLMFPIIFFILSGGIIGLIYKSQLINFEKYIAMFKFIFYLVLAVLTLLLDVTVVKDKIENIDFIIPDKLTIGQFLLITLSVLEAGSNLVDFLKVPKSEFHLLSREDYRKDRNDDFLGQMKTIKRIVELEKEIKTIKGNNISLNSLNNKKKRGKKRKK
ncbi:MAG: hypothetical protein ABTA23_12170 [Solibacillus sp.]